ANRRRGDAPAGRPRRPRRGRRRRLRGCRHPAPGRPRAVDGTVGPWTRQRPPPLLGGVGASGYPGDVRTPASGNLSIAMQILLIAYEFPPSPSPQSLRWAYLARHLADRGHRISVLTIHLGGETPGLPPLPSS